jgi:Xaa-Pro aminopeptidase
VQQSASARPAAFWLLPVVSRLPVRSFDRSAAWLTLVLSFSAMRLPAIILSILFMCCSSLGAPEITVLRERRQLAAAAFKDGILLLHASSALEDTADGFRQDPFFYYFTGLENTVGSLLAIDGTTGESWLFLPSKPPYSKSGVPQEVELESPSGVGLRIDHVVDWTDLENFFGSQAKQARSLYYADHGSNFEDLPPNLQSPGSSRAPTWLQIIALRWPTFEVKNATGQVEALMEVQSADEISALRSAAKATVSAIIAGMRAIHTGVSQRSVEAAVEYACWNAGAHGSSFWPWVMAGDNAVFPRPFASLVRYDHLDRTMRSGEMVRLDVGCESDHYIGDLGRTVPVSGHYDAAQRESWNIFVAAYHAAARVLHDGVTVDEIFDAWQKELISHRPDAKSSLAQHAIDSWIYRKNVPFWQIHTTNLLAGRPSGRLRKGMTINFEPIASVDGQGFFLEDMYVVTKHGSEILTPGVPYSAEDIEAAMSVR